jgi:Serine aminopeptidase, S33
VWNKHIFVSSVRPADRLSLVPHTTRRPALPRKNKKKHFFLFLFPGARRPEEVTIVDMSCLLNYCCCCCPSAITALFCLYVQSGCRKGTVAGALTFFPPEPALYQFERRAAADGRVLEDDDDDEDENDDNENNNKEGGEREEADADENDDSDDARESHQRTPKTTTNTSTKMTTKMKKKGKTDNPEKIEIRETRQETNRRMRSPMEQLLEAVQERVVRSKVRQVRDARDADRGVRYNLLLDPRLQIPPHDADCIRAVKIPCCRSNSAASSNPCSYIAAVGYVSDYCYMIPRTMVVVFLLPSSHTRVSFLYHPFLHRPVYWFSNPTCIQLVPAERKVYTTLIISHGNATDIGAMFAIQILLAHALDINVVSYDYSGYGESGGVPDEHATYRDLQSVLDYVIAHWADRDARNVILYGQSVGSGPCCYVAMRPPYVGGLILHSPFTSGMRVLTSSRYVFFSSPRMFCVDASIRALLHSPSTSPYAYSSSSYSMRYTIP